VETNPFTLNPFQKGDRSMFFPLIPILALAAIFGGGASLLWYDSLTREEKERANRLTTKYAAELFGKTVKELSESQASRVHDLVRKHFDN
jgi:hypothetical protein